MVSFNLDSVLAGYSIANNKLNMGDKIIVYSKDEIIGTITQTVEISGFIKNPGVYELANNMTLLDLIFMSAGINDKAYAKDMILKRLDLIRYEPYSNERTLIKIDLDKLLKDGLNNYKLKAGDRAIVYSKNLFEDIEKNVSIYGVVNSPGPYEMHDKMTIGDLILLAGGIRNKVKFVKIELSRYDEYEDLTNIITMNYMNTFEQLNSNNKSLNYLLENNDLVNIYSMDKSPFKSVSINGEISFPGQYVLVDEGNDIHSIIKRAGGLTDVANSSFATVVRA